MNSAFQELMDIRGRDDGAGAEISGADPVFSTRFKVAETGAGILAAVGVAVSDIWQMKTGRRQSVAIDVRHAGAALNSFAFLQARQDDGSYRVMGNSPAATANYQITQPFATKDGRWFLPHFGIAHLKDRVLGVLKCESTPESVAQAVGQWEAQELEDAIAEARACGGMIRTNAEWLAHPQGRALAAQPVVEVEKIGDSEPEPFPNDDKGDGPALAGVRVLDLTRILAGPVAARTCAEHGADVLMVAAKGLPQIKNFVVDLSHGKRSCYLNLNDGEEAEQLRQLVRGADVFSQGYRPGVLDRRGFGAAELAALRPGLIYTSINCYGQHGPFQDRAGWEQVAQSITGICHENGAERPALLPVPACDYTTGYLGAYGTLLALARRAVEGGSYHVRVSLCQSGMFLYRQGRVDYPEAEMGHGGAEYAALQMESDTSYGHIRHLAPVIRFSESRPGWSRPSPALGADRAEWLN
ncbi:MAG: CoA transferase [Alphaproteobacteria bacterium]|nr:CoA transferase [Alphaproteobacteria bacterium]